MATASRRAARRSRRPTSVAKPSGSIHPRVQKVTPEHFGIVAVDCAKARSKWMLIDFYGNILIPPTTVEHNRPGLDQAVARVRQAIATHDLRDTIVAIERTGNYHQPVRHAFAAAGFEARIVHPLASKQFRLPADPGNKTDDTDLAAIQRAAVNGFGLIEPAADPIHDQLRLLARHRRDLVRKNATLRNQIHVELDALLPGLSAAVGNIFDHEPVLVIARRLGSAQAIRARGLDGLAALLQAEGLRYQRRSLEKVLAWAEQAHEPDQNVVVHKRIFAFLDEERRSLLRSIRALESDLAALLVRTPYVVLLSFPGINVVSAAEFAGEMGPIRNAPRENAITGRAGLYPARYQSDQVDHTGPLVGRANRSLRYVLLLIGENLMKCNKYFHDLSETWRATGLDQRAIVVRAAKRFCRIAYHMVASGQVFHHPSYRGRHYILEKLSTFYLEHDIPMEQVLRDLREAIAAIPRAEYAAEAERLQALAPAAIPTAAPAGAATGARQLPTGTPATPGPGRPTAAPSPAAAPPPNLGRRRTGPRPLSAILPELLLRLGVTMVESNPSGETDPT
ncbi:MAG: IS110 family transposase [Isosphaeraceae bacterium]